MRSACSGTRDLSSPTAVAGVSVVKATAISALAVAAAFALSGCRASHEPAAPDPRPPVAATIATAVEGSLASGLVASATIEPIRRASPGTILMGRVERILRREGDVVRAGETLALIDNRDMAAREGQAEAGLAAARATEANARAMRERMQRLVDRQAASRKMLEDATLGHEAAVAQLEAAGKGLEAAKVATAYGRVTAPFDGVVTERLVEVGDLAAPGRPLFVIEDTRRVKVDATVPESVAATLASGSQVEIEVGEIRRAGTIEEVLPAADPRSRTVTVRVVLDNADGALRSGAFARLAVGGVEAGAGAISVPETALVRRGPLAGVFVVDDGDVARLRWLSVGSTRAGSVEVLAGLVAGERYVAAPAAGLEDGIRVTASAEPAR